MEKSNLYYLAFFRKFTKYQEVFDSDDIFLDEKKKMILLGVKAIGQSKKTETVDKKTILLTYNYLIELMKTITFEEFENIFPIDKVYDGEKFECKDYFYTKEMMKSFDVKSKIGNEIDSFLWDYTNKDIRCFNVAVMGLVIDFHKKETGQDLFRNWIDEIGKERKIEFDTYIEIKNGNKKYLMNNRTKEIYKVRYPRPKHLKLIK